jgi:hypothetical protein
MTVEEFCFFRRHQKELVARMLIFQHIEKGRTIRVILMSEINTATKGSHGFFAFPVDKGLEKGYANRLSTLLK